jgi:hypothetical protein
MQEEPSLGYEEEFGDRACPVFDEYIHAQQARIATGREDHEVPVFNAFPDRCSMPGLELVARVLDTGIADGLD